MLNCCFQLNICAPFRFTLAWFQGRISLRSVNAIVMFV